MCGNDLIKIVVVLVFGNRQGKGRKKRCTAFIKCEPDKMTVNTPFIHPSEFVVYRVYGGVEQRMNRKYNQIEGKRRDRELEG